MVVRCVVCYGGCSVHDCGGSCGIRGRINLKENHLESSRGKLCRIPRILIRDNHGIGGTPCIGGFVD